MKSTNITRYKALPSNAMLRGSASCCWLNNSRPKDNKSMYLKRTIMISNTMLTVLLASALLMRGRASQRYVTRQSLVTSNKSNVNLSVTCTIYFMHVPYGIIL